MEPHFKNRLPTKVAFEEEDDGDKKLETITAPIKPNKIMWTTWIAQFSNGVVDIFVLKLDVSDHQLNYWIQKHIIFKTIGIL